MVPWAIPTASNTANVRMIAIPLVPGSQRTERVPRPRSWEDDPSERHAGEA